MKKKQPGLFTMIGFRLQTTEQSPQAKARFLKTWFLVRTFSKGNEA
jgi:hypothetical protein